MTNKDKFTMLRRVFGFEKDKQYLAWVKSLFPNYDLHHILGSTTGKKFTDYLVIPLSHEEHLNKAENYKADYCIKHYNFAVGILLRYAKEKSIVEDGFFVKNDSDLDLLSPEEVKNLIKLINN